jgi:hypothetical protein
MKERLLCYIYAKQKNSKKQGNIGLAHAILWLEKHDYQVYIPLTDSQDADLVADIDGKLCRIQVKTTYFKSPYGIYKANLRVSGGNRSGTGKVKLFDPSKVEYVFVITEEEDKYFIPTRVLEVRNSLALGEKYALYKVE